MIAITLYSLMVLMVSAALAGLVILAGKKSTKDREKLTPFECGFEPFEKSRAPFSLRFFLVTVVFLVFDLEIALILPMGAVYQSTESAFLGGAIIYLMALLLGGLIHEWNHGALKWI